MMKKPLSQFVLLCVALCALCVLRLTAGAADIVDSGTCGDNLTWTLDSDGVLTISGDGAMGNWTNSNYPWRQKRLSVFSVIIHDGVASIGSNAFYGCASLTNAVIPDSVTRICDSAFFACIGLKSVAIPDSVTNIDTCAFSRCRGLTSVTIPGGVSAIGSSSFSNCTGLTSVTISNGVNSIGEWAFDGCAGLTGVTIPDSVTRIAPNAFLDCKSLTSVIFNGVISIGANAFARCSELASVTIGDGVNYIGGGAFGACDNLSDIYYAGSVAQWNEISVRDGNDALKKAAIHYDAKDIGIGIALTDENGKAVDPQEDTLENNSELTANFAVTDSDAPAIPGELVAASIFAIFYDDGGLMVSLRQWEMDLSDPLNIFFVQTIRIPAGAKTMKILMLGDNFEPLRAQRLIQSSADNAA